MLKRIWKMSPVSCILFLALTCFTVATFFMDWHFALIETATIICISIILVFRRRLLMSDVNRNVEHISKLLDERNRVALINFPLPVLVADSEGNVLWYSDKFKNRIIGENEVRDRNIQQFTSGIGVDSLSDSDTFTCEYQNRMFSVWTSVVEDESTRLYIMYFFDDTAQKRQVRKYVQSQPCVLLITIDNLDEIIKNARESEKAEMNGIIEKLLEDWINETNGFLKRLSGSRFFAVVEEQNLKKMMEDKFSILNTVRNHVFGELTGATLSIGVGRGGNLAECEEMARQALDMALGRGGDQAVIKYQDAFEFFGGASASVEKRTKVKTRVVATALFELMEGSDSVYIMGHRFADFDALGSAIGLWSAAHAVNKEAHIIMSRKKSLAGLLLDRVEAQGLTDMVLEPKEALARMTERSLLIITDTHRPDFVDEPEVYRSAKTVVVIDHHRKTIDHIANAVIFYHEPGASSASEMVAELLQYMKQTSTVNKPVAEALLAGIMLDTRNFVLRTGVRTFEAAAFLRSCGADTIGVKQLFSNSIENYQMKTNIVANTEVYHDCAIAIAESETEDIRVVSSQAADELLTINGIKASFVIFRTQDIVNISARSLGNVNVQLIMEAIGGGGHHTMAATQLENITMSDAKVKLLEAIDAYLLRMQ